MVSYRFIGSGTTDEHGIAHITKDAEGQTLEHPGYTGTGAGLIDVVASTDNEISESSVVSQPFVVDDTYNYDDGTTASHHDIWTDTASVLTRYDEYSEIAETQGTDVAIITTIPSTVRIECDVYCDQVWQWFIEITQSNSTAISGWSLGNAYSSAQANTWYHMKLEGNSTNATLTLYNMQGTQLGTSTKNTGATIGKLLLKTRDQLTKIRFKNFRVYNQ